MTGPGSAGLYGGRPPWEIRAPSRPLLALADSGELHGRVLDVGCGTGEHTLMATAAGLDATGIDLAADALATAERKARERGLTTRFLRTTPCGWRTWVKCSTRRWTPSICMP